MSDPYAAMHALHGPDPRPFMRAALEEIAPDVATRFRAEFEKAMAEWDGKHRIVALPPALTPHGAFKILTNPVIGSDEDGVLAMCECGRGYAFGTRATGEELLAFLADHDWTRPDAAEEGGEA